MTPLPVLTEDKVRELRDLGYARICQPERGLVVALADHWLRTQAGAALIHAVEDWYDSRNRAERQLPLHNDRLLYVAARKYFESRVDKTHNQGSVR